MTTSLVVAITVVAVVLGVLGIVSTVARRRIGLLHLGVAGLLEVLLLVQAVVAVVALAAGERPPETATFLGYLAGIVLVPIAGSLWARSEQTRWAGTVIAVAAAVVGVMIWRLLQLWEATGA
ncbi:MAG: putative integral rane protein [Blastococcus sp.]|nr:putative integral rane protein [Blastococcus sp.]